MNHKPFEEWILDRPSLTGEEQQALQQHLAVCPNCRMLAEKWAGVRVELSAPAQMAPAPGFARRWQAGLAERRLQEQRRQAWHLFLACSGTATAMFIGVAAYFIIYSTPADWVQAAVQTISSTVGIASTARSLLNTWLQLTPLSLNIALWISISVTFCIMAFLWAFAMWRTSIVGAFTK